MGTTFAFAWEYGLIVWLQRFMSEAAVKIAGIITEFGDATVLVGVIGLFYWALSKETGKKLVVLLSTANIINPSIKTTVQRRRPYMDNSSVKCLKPVNSEGDIYDVVSQEFSFPSGHAVNCVSVYGTLAAQSRRKAWKCVLAVLILLVGVSRFALGVHYPTDVLAGWAVGALSVALYGLLEKKLGRYRTYILLDIIGIAGFFYADTNDYFTGYGMLIGSTLGIMFEEKFVNFEGTRKVLPAFIRTACGAGLYLGLNTLLKMPFTEAFLNSGTTAAFAVRAARYAVIVFLLLGVYPLCFRRGAASGSRD